LPADKNNDKKINSIFRTLIKPISQDLAREGAFQEVITNLENLHYVYEVTHFGDRIGHVSLLNDEHLKIHIRPMRDKNQSEISMTQWYEHPESMREFDEEYNHGITGSYYFQAEFELVHDDWNPDAAEDDPNYEYEGEGVIGSVQCTAYNFQEFIEDAVRKLSIKFNTDLYPKRIPLKRKIA
jgi:hypothetical protein